MGFFDCFTGGSVSDIVAMYNHKPIKNVTSSRAAGHLYVYILYQDGTRVAVEQYWDAGERRIRAC